MILSTLVLFLVLSLPGIPRVNAAPFSHSLVRRGIPISIEHQNSLAQYAQFARVAYCPTSKIDVWRCGEACDALPGFEPTLVGGDGNAIQNYFVGFWEAGNTIIVGRQGTVPSNLRADLTDIRFKKAPLDTKYFPGASNKIRVHKGFRNEHARTADFIFHEVSRLIARKHATQVTTVGHSLGGALVILEALSLRLLLPSTISIRVRTFGAPRVGNQDFVTFFDSKISDIERTNNRQDLVPIIPGRFLGFKHPKGEIHIMSRGVVACPFGEDSKKDKQCTVATVGNILEGSLSDHSGPYLGVMIGSAFCT